MKYMIFTYTVIALLCTFCVAQAPDTLWTRTYGGEHIDVAHDIQPTADNGYIITGNAEWIGQDEYGYLYLIRIDHDGDTLWTRVFGTEAELATGYSVQQTSDGGYIAAGVRRLPGQAWEDVYVVKTDAAGDTVWIKVLGGGGYDGARAVIQTSDGSYVIAGKTTVSGVGQLYLIKMDANGDTVWTKTYGGSGTWAGAYAIQETEEGGFAVAGYIDEDGEAAKMWLLRTNPAGDTVWTCKCGPDGWDTYAWALQTTDDNGYIGYILTGETVWSWYWRCTYIVKTDKYGDTLWTRMYYGTDESLFDDHGTGVQQTSDGGYVVVGSRSQYPTWVDIYVLRTDSLGDTLWSACYSSGPGILERGHAILVTSDDGYIIAGIRDQDAYVLKTEHDETGIKEHSTQYTRTLDLSVHPNPFSNAIQIRYEIRDARYAIQDFSLQIYDITGRVVKQWNYPTIQQSNDVVWDGTDDNDRAVPSGVYFVELATQNHRETKKLVLMR